MRKPQRPKKKEKDTTSFVSAPEFNWLMKLSFDSLVEEAGGKPCDQNWSKNTLVLWDKNSEK